MPEFIDKVKDFVKTPRGKLAIGAAAGGIFFIIILIIIYFIFLGAPPEVTPEVKELIPSPPVSKEVEATVTVPPLTEGFEVYGAEGFKNPFKKLYIESTTTPASGSLAEHRIALKGITYSDGVYSAELIYNGESFQAKEGEIVSNSPYMVLSIGMDWVKLLYGDNTFTLHLGEEHVEREESSTELATETIP